MMGYGRRRGSRTVQHVTGDGTSRIVVPEAGAAGAAGQARREPARGREPARRRRPRPRQRAHPHRRSRPTWPSPSGCSPSWSCWPAAASRSTPTPCAARCACCRTTATTAATRRRPRCSAWTSSPAAGAPIRPKTLNQKRYVDAIDAHTIVFGIGPAGTGKTYLAMAKAVQALQAKQVNRIILTRPAVEAGERLGFLPGTLYGEDRPVPAPALRRAARHARPGVDPAS